MLGSGIGLPPKRRLRNVYEQGRAAPEGIQKRAVIIQTQIPLEPDNLNSHEARAINIL
jgi:hypothetical protein